MFTIKKKKLIFKNQVYKVYSNYIKSKTFIIKDYLSLEVKGKVYGGVCCIILNNNKIGLMKIYSPIAKTYFYSLIQGFTNYKESIWDAVKREVSEETGINEKKKNFKMICGIYPIQSLIKSKLAIFKLKLKTINKKNFKKVKTEIGVGKLYFFELKKLKKMLKKPNSFDLISFSALTYFLFLRK